MQIRDIPIDQNLKETTRHGSSAFPLAVYQSVLAENVLGFVNWHWHEELQFCYVTSGAVTFHIHEQQYLLLPGEGIFINSGYLHMARPTGGTGGAYLCLNASSKLLSSFPNSVFETVYLSPYLSLPALASVPLRLSTPWQQEILACIPQIYALSEEKVFGYELRILMRLNQMWLALLEHPMSHSSNRSEQNTQSNATVQAILTCIHQHFQEPLSLDQISRQALFSPSECCRIFKKVTGDTIFSYLQSYRLTRSIELLHHTSLSVSRIAYETGFCSTSYFIKVFKGNFAVTPHQYRKALE